jgi:hypothetical protein
MSGAPFKKLPASPSVSCSSVPVADRGGEEINVGFSDFGAGSGNQLRDPRARRKDGDRAEARRLVIDGIEIMKRLEQQGPLDTNAQDTLNKLNEIATALTSSSRK